MNVEDSSQSGNSKYTFSLEDLIDVKIYYDVYHDDNSVNHVGEPLMEDGFEQRKAYKSTFDISKTVHPHIEDFNKSDVNRLKDIISEILNNYKSILEQSPQQILELIENFGNQIRPINRKLMGLYKQINQILRVINSGTDKQAPLSEKTFFEILSEDKLTNYIFSKNSLCNKETEELESLILRSIKWHQKVKNGFMRLRVLQVIQNNYHSYLFQNKMEELEQKCLQIIAKEEVEEVKREINFLTSEGRYKIFRKLTSKHKRKEAVVILEKELVRRLGYKLSEIRESPDSYDPANSHKAFLNAYDAWTRNNKDKT